MADKSLRQWSIEAGLPYSSTHYKHKKGTLEGVETYEKNGHIYVKEAFKEDSKPVLNTQASSSSPVISMRDVKNKPVSVSFASEGTGRRRNAASTLVRTDRFANIELGINPFKHNQNAPVSTVSVSEAIVLVQLAYYNFAIFRNIIDLMTEFSVSNIYFQGGNAKSRAFCEAWMRKWGSKSFQDKFYREFYRSGTVPIFSYLAKIKEEDINKLKKAYGTDSSFAKKVEIPVRYIILNPADIEISGCSSFVSPVYYKVLSDYELSVLKNPRTKEDKEIFENLPEETKKQIKNKKSGTVLFPLPMNKVKIISYKRQDYEPFSVPIGYSVLEDINFKLELRKIDMAVSRTVNQCILLITMGYEGKDGSYNFNQTAADSMKQIFENESVGRVLISDFTTEAKFLIPDIAAILDPKKYESVDKDIKEGLNQVMMGGDEKFANRSMAVKVFTERLNSGREVFLDEFLIPEIKKVCDEMGFKSCPTPKYENIDSKDEAEYARLVTRLAEIGYLTPPETFTAIDTGRLPTGEESEEAQGKYKLLRDKGYYQPIAGGPADQMEVLKETQKHQMKTQEKQCEHDDKQKQKDRKHAADNPQQPAPQIVLNSPTKLMQPKGRPGGSSSPKTKQKVKPMKASVGFSMTKIKDNFRLASDLHNTIEARLLKLKKIESLNGEQKEMCDSVAGLIIANEEPKNWLDEKVLGEYMKSPFDKNPEKVAEIEQLALDYATDFYTASILNHCQAEFSEDDTILPEEE